MPKSLLRILGCGCLVLSAACTSPPPPAPAVAPPPASPPPEPPTRAARPLTLADARAHCESLARQAPPELRIQRSEFIAAGIAYPMNWATHRIEGRPLPEHCRVNGAITAAPGSAAGGIGFEMRLPTQWSGRYFQQGSTDRDGLLFDAIGRTAGAAGFDDNALGRGFAVMSSEAGALDSLATPKLSPAERQQRAEESLHRAALAGQALATAYYGKPPQRSYFVGCSEGGREGLIYAQRWPALFDGVVAVAPVLREADAAMAAAWRLQRFTAVSPRARGGKPQLWRAFSNDELFTVAQGILSSCDALDGAEDGFVMDMAACSFEPAELTCKRGKRKDCLSKARTEALREAMAGPRDAAGQALYVPWPWDPGIAAPGWRAWTLGSGESRPLLEAAGALGMEYADPPDARLNAANFNFDRDPKRLQPARDADAAFVAAPLDEFRARQGKLLLIHGAADPVVSAWATVDYQRRLNDTMGAEQAATFARSFVVPGMNHCAGGPSTDRFDALGAVVDWVEQDEAPQRIEARGSAVLHDETRPLCPWPQVARYAGSGPLHDSASYACR